MKTTKKSKGKGGSEPSILDYFSKSKRQKSTSSPLFGTPATPTVALSRAVNGSETPASIDSDDAAMPESNPVRRNKPVGSSNKSMDIGRTPDSDSSSHISSTTTPDTHKPTTPPSPSPGNCVRNQSIVLKGQEGSIKSAQSSETPPSNDTDMTTRQTPPTPEDTWRRVCPADQKENDSHNRNRDTPCINESRSNMNKGIETPKSLLDTHDMSNHDDIMQQEQPQEVNSPHNRKRDKSCCSGDNSSSKEDVVETPKSLLDTLLQPQHQQAVNMGTPSTACTPSTTTTFAVPQSNNFFRRYYATSSKKSPRTKKIKDQNTLFSKTDNTNKPTKKLVDQSNQLFLDFGQNSFGKQTICNICGMLRVHGLDEDDAQHAKICKEYKEGVTCLGWKNERQVGTLGKDDRILEVRPEDAQQHRNKVLEVKTIVDKELGFARRNIDDPSSAEEDMTCYMCISKKRVVGLVMVKRVQRAYELLPSEEGDDANNNGGTSSISRSLKPSKALLGVHQIWVHRLHRHRGIASKLVTAARDHLIFGMVVPLELVAFSSPTDEGLRFAKSYVGSERPLIYDIH